MTFPFGKNGNRHGPGWFIIEPNLNLCTELVLTTLPGEVQWLGRQPHPDNGKMTPRTLVWLESMMWPVTRQQFKSSPKRSRYFLRQNRQSVVRHTTTWPYNTSTRSIVWTVEWTTTTPTPDRTPTYLLSLDYIRRVYKLLVCKFTIC